LGIPRWLIEATERQIDPLEKTGWEVIARMLPRCLWYSAWQVRHFQSKIQTKDYSCHSSIRDIRDKNIFT